ncbi:MAG: hypothetical protein EOO43_02185 [Flavobacterium sp.]|nr:MAG: hypothetical protein EOO43_02185 [Flavobacterium sp.]
MDSANFHFVFPKDETTDFLQEVIDHIIDNTEANVTIHRLSTVDEHVNFFANAQTLIPRNATIMFMGHGMSYAVSGAHTPDLTYGPYVSENQLSIFKDRKVVLLTCRSNEYLNNYGLESGLKAGIGFPNLITDDYELIHPDEPERVNGVTNQNVKDFRRCLLDIIKFSLEDYINLELSFYQLFKRIQIRVQRHLIGFYTNNRNLGKLPYGKMLYDLNHGIEFIGN